MTIVLVDKEGEMVNAGSGFVVKTVQQEDGTWVTYVMTACHVIYNATAAEGGPKVVVMAFRHDKFEATAHEGTILRYDMDLDVAILSFTSDEEYPCVAQLSRRADPLEVWDEVLSVGRDTQGVPRFWSGVVNFWDGTWLGFSAPVHPGCSGGPLLSFHDGRWWVEGIILRVGVQGFNAVYHCGMALSIQQILPWLGNSEITQFLTQ